MKFDKLYMTCGVKNCLENGDITEIDLGIAIKKFTNNDFGLLCEEDKKLQYELLKNENNDEMIMGIYKGLCEKFWLIWEKHYEMGGKRIVTALLPSEY